MSPTLTQQPENADTGTTPLNLHTSRRMRGRDADRSADRRVAENDTSRTNIAAGARASSANNAMGGPRVENNDAGTGARQTNLAAGAGAEARYNRAHDPDTVQANLAYNMCWLL
ncbi:hypothetical protein MKX08_010210 [Trichoderma sp. CBMAI-0020]|nr:hypothetical protein MKX08_010210 [Trichoderma sp. CBMAI-0020]